MQAAEESEEDGEFPSELRYDIASKSWVVIASGRSKRPEMFKEKEEVDPVDENCPFCKEECYKHLVEVSASNKIEDPTSGLPDNWTIAVIPNKFPAFMPSEELNEKNENGLYRRMNAVGYHEVIITRDHQKSPGKMDAEEIKELLGVYKRRYLELREKKFVNYISIFHNHGKRAGASISHPHSQLVTTPLVDVDVGFALDTAKKYIKRKGKCLYCAMQEWEMEKKKRVVYENDLFLVLCPFASKVAFQIIVTPKEHSSRFEKINEDQLDELAQAFSAALKKIYKGVGNPPYNFYLHTAPCDGENHDYYHWHFTILPKTATFAGFELGAGMEISTVRPEEAAEYLRNI